MRTFEPWMGLKEKVAVVFLVMFEIAFVVFCIMAYGWAVLATT